MSTRASHVNSEVAMRRYEHTNYKFGCSLGQCIPDRTGDDEDAANVDAPFSAPCITDPSSWEAHYNCRKDEGGRNEAQPLTLWVLEIVVPVRHGLEASEQGLIICSGH